MIVKVAVGVAFNDAWWSIEEFVSIDPACGATCLLPGGRSCVWDLAVRPLDHCRIWCCTGARNSGSDTSAAARELNACGGRPARIRMQYSAVFREFIACERRRTMTVRRSVPGTALSNHRLWPPR